MSRVYVFLDDRAVARGAQNRREAWMPKSGGSYYDPCAQRTFQSRRDKRAWLARHGMRETGMLVNPSKPIQGRAKTRVSPEARRRHQLVRQHIQRLGGVLGLLTDLKRRGVHVG